MGVVGFEEALETVRQHALASGAGGLNCVRRGQPRSERVALLAAAGRVLAESVRADRDQPPFDRATRDGYAVRAEETGAGALKVAGQVRAGQVWQQPLQPGTALQIMTGAPVPQGADAVVMVEHVAVDAGEVRLSAGRTLRAGENFVPRGREAKAGQEVIANGTEVSAAEIALAASCGCVDLEVLARPTVAIVATGDELVEVAETPEPEQIRNSNSYALAALVTAAGGRPQRLVIASDLRDEIRERITQGRMADLLLLSGGVSMGEYDLVEEVLAESGAEFLFTGVAMQPGKPLVFGRLPARQVSPQAPPEPECYFFGLPGNPISTQVTFHCFAEPFLRVLAGQLWTGPRWVQATLGEDVEAKAGLTRLLPAHRDGVTVRVIAWQGSGDLASNARANCYAELLPGLSYTRGDVIRILLR